MPDRRDEDERQRRMIRIDRATAILWGGLAAVVYAVTMLIAIAR